MSRTPETVNRIPPQVSIGTFALLCTCFVVSGVAALVYQTAWTRQFAIVFGTSELAVATVLAAYMGGLALGALLAERFLPRVTRPVLTYALLELGIAGSAVIVVPLLLLAANLALQAMFGGQPSPPDSDHAGTTLFYLLSAFVALALPTTLMGATLPMLARYAVAEEAQIGRRIGMLYAMNTAGAVAGALLTAFVLLPELGLTHTIWFGAFSTASCSCSPWRSRAAFRSKTPSVGYELDATASTAAARAAEAAFLRVNSRGRRGCLPLMLLAGAVAFFQEVLWTRMLAHVVGSSIYAFGVMVASFLTGIAARWRAWRGCRAESRARNTGARARADRRRHRGGGGLSKSRVAAAEDRGPAGGRQRGFRTACAQLAVRRPAAAAHDPRHRHDLSTRRAHAGE